MVTLQVFVPVQPDPLHPMKPLSGDAVAVRVTLAPCTKSWEQVAPQLMPAGELVTVPVPLPSRVTERVGDWASDWVMTKTVFPTRIRAVRRPLPVKGSTRVGYRSVPCRAPAG